MFVLTAAHAWLAMFAVFTTKQARMNVTLPRHTAYVKKDGVLR